MDVNANKGHGHSWHQQSQIFGDGVNGQAARDGLRQHGRVVRAYNLIADNCLGFAIIKMGTGFGEFRDRSNSINYVKHKLGDNPRMSPSGRSVRMPEPWSNTLKEWLESKLGTRLQESYMR